MQSKEEEKTSLVLAVQRFTGCAIRFGAHTLEATHTLTLLFMLHDNYVEKGYIEITDATAVIFMRTIYDNMTNGWLYSYSLH